MNKQYKFVEPKETQNKMIEVLVKGLGRKLTDQEIETIFWLGDADYQTRGVLLDLFKELAEKGEK